MKENKFAHEWAIWYTYQPEYKEGHGKLDNKDYNDNIQQIFSVDTPSDLAYLWKNSPIALPSNYFGREGGKQYTYVFIIIQL